MTRLGTSQVYLATVIGILLGFAGLAMVALAYPVHNSVLKKERQRIAPEILRLSEEWLKQQGPEVCFSQASGF